MVPSAFGALRSVISHGALFWRYGLISSGLSAIDILIPVLSRMEHRDIFLSALSGLVTVGEVFDGGW